MRAPVLVDLRNVYRGEQVRGKGFRYVDIGRGILPPARDETAGAA
ncbi:MAG: hypothetical protein QM784_34930 [Polyangiaceae bacterium]